MASHSLHFWFRSSCIAVSTSYVGGEVEHVLMHQVLKQYSHTPLCVLCGIAVGLRSKKLSRVVLLIVAQHERTTPDVFKIASPTCSADGADVLETTADPCYRTNDTKSRPRLYNMTYVRKAVHPQYGNRVNALTCRVQFRNHMNA